MIEFKIKRGKYEDKFFVAVIMKDPTIIKPLSDGISHFFEVLDYKRERVEKKIRTEGEKLE
jgi:hypothetical protein